MPQGLLAKLSAAEITRLREMMEWVIPSDSSPGAGSDSCLLHLGELIDSLGAEWVERYIIRIPTLTEQDLANPADPFASAFINHVRDCYYGYADCGAWEDIGFVVTG